MIEAVALRGVLWASKPSTSAGK